VQDAAKRCPVQAELAAMPDALNHAERNRGNDEYQN
jgi:hypothetical protein